MTQELTPFERAALDTRAVLDRLGGVAARMESLYAETCALADDLGREMEQRGKPESQRAGMEYNLIVAWATICSQFSTEFLRTSLQQGSEIGRLPQGPRPVNPFKHSR